MKSPSRGPIASPDPGPAASDPAPAEGDAAATARERDLYASLLELGRQVELPAALRRALALIVAATGAEQGYLELAGAPGGPDGTWAIAHQERSPDELEAIRRRISLSIVREALDRGEVLESVSAVLDARFQDKPSVRSNRIEAVICAPIGAGAPLGVLYLQGGHGQGPLSPTARLLVERFVHHAEPVLRRLRDLELARRSEDPTRTWRERLDVEGVVGRSRALARVLADVDLVAARPVPVLLTGEHGTGKSLVARAIHRNGPRPGGPFVHVNSATIPEALLESELFGALPGSHSTARERREGRVAAARGGTLFLDEVAELSLGCQARLLQLLEEGLYYPLGSATPEVADIRVVSATNADLDRRIAAGAFRADLYYRLRGVQIRLPALRERAEDVGPLVTRLCERLAGELRAAVVYPSAAALELLRGRRWPGNVRELENVLREGLLRADRERAQQIETGHLFPSEAGDPGEPEAARSWHAATRAFQRGFLRRVLEEHGWNVAEAARRLELSRAHVYNLLRELDLQRPG